MEIYQESRVEELQGYFCPFGVSGFAGRRCQALKQRCGLMPTSDIFEMYRERQGKTMGQMSFEQDGPGLLRPGSYPAKGQK